jgi:hypothetical protein
MTQSGGAEPRPSEAAVLERLRSLVESRVLPLVRPTRVWPVHVVRRTRALRAARSFGVGETDLTLSSLPP